MDEVDERAKGLCLEPLFQHGIPGVGVIDTMLKELDDQLLENNKQIEECVKELIDMSSGMAGPDVKFTNPAEAINYVTENHLLEKTACYDPEPDDVTRFLRHVIMVLEKHPGCEESVLDQLLQFSSQEGVALPIRSSMSDPMAQSILSINTAVDSAEHVNENLWSDISMRLRKYFIEKLQSLPLVMNKDQIQNNSQKRLKYVQSLCTLYPTPSIWPKYRNIRLHQLEALTFTLEIKEGKVSKFQKAVVELERILPQIIAMIDEDFQLLTSGVFGSVVAPFKGISEIYFEKLLDDISNIVESLQEELSVAVQKQDVKKKERHKETKDIPKSTSEAGFLGNLKGNLRRQHSLSMDSLLDKTDEPFTDLAVLPTDYLGGILRLINSIVEIETHLEGLYNTLIWESTGYVGHKPTSKRRLKSALKSSHNMEEKKPPAFRSRSFEKSGMLPDAIPPPFGASQAMIAEMSASLRVVEKPYEDRPRWEWRALFRKLAPDITRCVEGHVHHASHKVTRDELQILERHGSLPTVAVAPPLAGGRLDYPKIVSEGFLEMMTVLDELLPLAQAGNETPFTSVRSVFLDATLLTLKSMNMQLAKLCADSPGLMPSNCLALMLSNAAYARNHLLYYEKVLGIDESNKKSFNGLHHQYEELVEALCRQIKEHHIQLLRTSVLHDAESHNWSDDKEFYENERCSFDIQMWNLHLQTLRHELWTTCPPRLAQSIFLDVLVESLEVLSSRYSRVKPSYRRTAQFRADIVTILLCTSELLFPACDTVTKYLDPSICETVVYKLHNCCHTLLTALTVVAAPLETLYKVYKKGFKKRRQNHDDDSVEGYLTQWLSWIRPSLFPQGVTNCSELQTTTAIHLQLKLMHSQPQLNWSMLLKSLLMKDYTLPIMLLTKMAEQHQSEAKTDSEPSKAEADVTEIFCAFVDIMMKCDTFPAALARIVSPVLDRTSAWSLLDSKKILGKTDPIPPWMLALFKSISAHTTRVIEPAIAVFRARLSNTSPQKDPLVCKMVELPCGCEPINTPDDGAVEKTSTSMTDIAAFSMRVYPVLGFKRGSRDIVAEALYSLITQLVEDLHTLPAPLLIFFNNAQSHLEDMRIQSTHNCAGLKMLATAIRTMLLDLQYIETLVDSPLTEDMRDCLKMLAECFYYVLTASSYGKGSGTPRIAGLFMKANTSWLNEQIEVIVDHLTNDLFEPSDICPLEGATADFTDNLLLATASSILNSNTGETSLTMVYNLLTNNTEWITSQLDIPPLVGSGSRGSPRRLPMVLSTCPVKPKEFSPLQAYSQIGEYKMDHAAISEIDLPWQSMLQSDLGLTELGFRTLLFHRQEMQDGAFLEEVEKKPVQVLKSKFDPEFLD